MKLQTSKVGEAILKKDEHQNKMIWVMVGGIGLTLIVAGLAICCYWVKDKHKQEEAALE